MPYDHLIGSNAGPHLCRWTDFKDLCTLIDVLRIASPNRVGLGSHGRHNWVAGGELGPSDFAISLIMKSCATRLKGKRLQLLISLKGYDLTKDGN